MKAEFIKKVKQADFLISRKATGNSRQCSKMLGISTASFYRLMDFMKHELDAPIEYNHYRQTFEYSREGNIELKFLEKK